MQQFVKSIKVDLDFSKIFHAFMSSVHRLRKENWFGMIEFITEHAKYLWVDANKELSDIHRECLEMRFDSNIERLLIEAKKKWIDIAEHISNECPYK